MELDLVEKIANAVLYEGYILYPYRPSAVKNQQRWNFGSVCPRSYSEAQNGTEAWTMQTECLVHGEESTELAIKVRFLHLLTREVCVPTSECLARIADLTDAEIQAIVQDTDLDVVPAVEVNGRLFQTWQEAVERDVILPSLTLRDITVKPRMEAFAFPFDRVLEPLRDESSGQIRGVIVRRQQAVEGVVEISSELVGEGVFRLTTRILNLSRLEQATSCSRDDALMRSFVSTHTILKVRDGEFVSLLDPPAEVAVAAAACVNKGTYPVLAGEEGSSDCMLSSPIILYDHPQIAPESAGELFDGTEIDEILTLRIMTLTDEEKHEMRGADDRARLILERTEQLPAEQLMKMHGVMRSLRPKDKEKAQGAGAEP
jgi:hypothetical protein